MIRHPYQETYQGIDFAITCAGVWVFLNWPTCAQACDRYFTNEERKNPTKDAMRAAIDRMIAGNVIFNGDIRDIGK